MFDNKVVEVEADRPTNKRHSRNVSGRLQPDRLETMNNQITNPKNISGNNDSISASARGNLTQLQPNTTGAQTIESILAACLSLAKLVNCFLIFFNKRF